MSDIGRKDSRGKTTLLLADGAPCYKGLSKMSKLLLRQCNHSKGVFSVWRSVHGRGSVRVHTGGIDAYWTLLKDGIPNSISSTELVFHQGLVAIHPQRDGRKLGKALRCNFCLRSIRLVLGKKTMEGLMMLMQP